MTFEVNAGRSRALHEGHPWLPVLLVVPGVGFMAWASNEMYRSGDEFERRKFAEAILLAFVIATPRSKRSSSRPTAAPPTSNPDLAIGSGGR